MKDHISVCICTFRRNQMLERLLRNLALQETAGLFDFSIVVVDNDARGLAEGTVTRASRELSLDVVYEVEEERTIPAARNRALALARGNFIAIIDDDEFPPPLWLVTMYRAVQAFGVDGALGPVHPFFETSPPSWLIKSGFCERPVHPTGTLLHWNQTRTGNVLLSKEVFDTHALRFDENFRTGGSDREFFMQAMEQGWRFIAVEEAPVYELVPPERWKKSYYLQRAVVNGINAQRYSADRIRGLERLMAPLKLALASAVYAAAMPFCALLGTHFLMNCLVRGGHHFSRLLAMMGIELIKRRGF